MCFLNAIVPSVLKMSLISAGLWDGCPLCEYSLAKHYYLKQGHKDSSLHDKRWKCTQVHELRKHQVQQSEQHGCLTTDDKDEDSFSV